MITIYEADNQELPKRKITSQLEMLIANFKKVV